MRRRPGQGARRRRRDRRRAGRGRRLRPLRARPAQRPRRGAGPRRRASTCSRGRRRTSGTRCGTAGPTSTTRCARSRRSRDTARADPRVALGLLDARHLAGDPSLTLRLRADLLAHWRRDARSQLPALRELVTRRGRPGRASWPTPRVPDLKESVGGLRDATVLKALVATWLVDVSHADLEPSRLQLLDVRDVLHAVAGRATDRVAPELWPDLAAGLGLARRRGRTAAGPRGRPPDHPPVPADLAAGRRRARAPARPPGAAPRSWSGSRPGWRSPAARWSSTGAPTPAGTRCCCSGPPPRPPSGGWCSPRPPRRRLARQGAPLPEPWGREARNLFTRLLAAGPGLLAGLGDPRRDRRAGAAAPRVGARPAAAARLGGAPVHRRPAPGRDLHRGVPADPPRLPARRADGRRAAARHRQGRSWSTTPWPGSRSPAGAAARMGFDDREVALVAGPGPLAPAARRGRHHPRPRGPGHGRRTSPRGSPTSRRSTCSRCSPRPTPGPPPRRRGRPGGPGWSPTSPAGSGTRCPTPPRAEGPRRRPRSTSRCSAGRACGPAAGRRTPGDARRTAPP